MNRKTLLVLIAIFFTFSLNVLSDNQSNVQRIVKNVTQFLGGSSFLNFKTYYAHGKLYIIKGSLSARTDVWEWALMPYFFRQAIDDRENGDIEIYDLKSLKGERISYGKKKAVGLDDISSFKVGLRKDIHYLFKYIIPSQNVDIFYLSPEDIEGPEFNEGLKIIFKDNDEVKIILKEDSYIPFKIIYSKKEGLKTVRWVKILARWFKIDGIETPKRVEYYKEGKLNYLIEYEEIKYNIKLKESLFKIR